MKTLPISEELLCDRSVAYYKPFSLQLHGLILDYLISEIVPDRKSYCDDSDLARIVDLLKEEKYVD